MYALWLDEIQGDRPRHLARERLDEYLTRPLEPEKAREFDRERFGMTGEDLRDRLASEAVWGDGQ